MKTTATHRRSLHQLAQLYGVQTAYYDVDHRRRPAAVASLLAVLHAMGAPVDRLDDVPSALRVRQQEIWRQPLDAVIVVWEGVATAIELRLPASIADASLSGHLRLENGESERWVLRGKQLKTLRAETIEGQRYVVKALPLKANLPWGYHRLTVDISTRTADTLIISAPKKAYTPDVARQSKTWGMFLPLYALHTQSSWGCGSFADLEALIRWVANLGGGVVATLPLLAAFLDVPCEPSPYAPASRLLWNAFYVDVHRALDDHGGAAARDVANAQPLQDEIALLRGMPVVDYRRQMALKRRVLETLARDLTASPHQLEAFQHFIKANPLVEDYASFRAVGERLKTAWSQWPVPLRNGIIKAGDADETNKRYHMVAQWLAYQQMQALSSSAAKNGSGLYLDLPLGVHADGYDVWRNQNLFVTGTRVGAPPDTFFALGQDWGFPPLHPERLRAQGYPYLIDVFKHHLRHAGILRIDHVMGLHRLYWVPPGHDARSGVYVRYRAEELYAILTLESHREQCWIVGENLGTVPAYVNAAMSRHGLGRMYVAQFEMRPDAKQPLRTVPTNTVVSFNTHDLPTFAAFWQGLDIADRQRMGLLSKRQVSKQKKELQELKKALVVFLQGKKLLQGPVTPEAVHAACMQYLSARSGHLLLINLEDLWQEEQPQNVPGTSHERPNWRRKARYAFEAFTELPEVVDVLRAIHRLRN
jgi:4-alpha-glucanotransferase